MYVYVELGKENWERKRELEGGNARKDTYGVIKSNMNILDDMFWI